MNILDIFFPKSCTVCSKKGSYLCERCRKLFKRSLPECYICRRVSTHYLTHSKCRKNYSLNSVFVGWEYNKLSSEILKRFKYKYTKDISSTLTTFFLNRLDNTTYYPIINNTVLVNIPISKIRRNERGFNQTYDIAKGIAEKYSLDFKENLLGRKHSRGHQAWKSTQDRDIEENSFYVKDRIKISEFKSITLVDDVITTGKTLEAATQVLREIYGEDLIVNAVCLFRGKPNYCSTESGTTSSEPSSTTTSSSEDSS